MDLDKVPSITKELAEMVRAGDAAEEDLIFVRNKLFAALGLDIELINNHPATEAGCKLRAVCECGGDKINSTHSHWCPKHEIG